MFEQTLSVNRSMLKDIGQFHAERFEEVVKEVINLREDFRKLDRELRDFKEEYNNLKKLLNKEIHNALSRENDPK